MLHTDQLRTSAGARLRARPSMLMAPWTLVFVVSGDHAGSAPATPDRQEISSTSASWHTSSRRLAPIRWAGSRVTFPPCRPRTERGSSDERATTYQAVARQDSPGLDLGGLRRSRPALPHRASGVHSFQSLKVYSSRSRKVMKSHAGSINLIFESLRKIFGFLDEVLNPWSSVEVHITGLHLAS